MKNAYAKYSKIIASTTAIIITAFVFRSELIAKESKSDEEFISWNAKGELNLPSDWREWVFVGTPVTPNDMNDGKAPFPEFHNVYIDPVSFAEYKESGNFPDGTVLIKELVSVGSKAAVSGKGYFMGDFIGLEATVKSSKQHPDEPGTWAYYSFTNPEGESLKKTAKKFEAASCNACHQASAEDDWVFTQYYPVLSAAKGSEK